MKRFEISYTPFSVVFILLGGVFAAIGGIAAFAPTLFTMEEAESVRLVFGLVFGILGIAFLAVGLVTLFIQASRRAKAKRLHENGQKILAEIVDCEPNFKMMVNGRPGYTLRCMYKNSSGRTYIFKSNLLRRNPEHYLMDKQVVVWHDVNDIARYHVDVAASIGDDVIEL